MHLRLMQTVHPLPGLTKKAEAAAVLWGGKKIDTQKLLSCK